MMTKYKNQWHVGFICYWRLCFNNLLVSFHLLAMFWGDTMQYSEISLGLFSDITLGDAKN